MTPLSIRIRVLILLSCAFVIAGCGGKVDLPTVDPSPTIESLEFDIVWPTLEMVEPSPVIIGQEMKIIGRGGYHEIETEAGIGYDESFRTFQVYLNDEPIGEIGCFVNRCEAEIKLPGELLPGQYELSVEGGSSIMISAEES
jgi:hypothetical protein